VAVPVKSGPEAPHIRGLYSMLQPPRNPHFPSDLGHTSAAPDPMAGITGSGGRLSGIGEAVSMSRAFSVDGEQPKSVPSAYRALVENSHILRYSR